MVLTIAAFIIILGFLVLVHELGHFLVAKKNGIAVDEFGLGFPPRAYGKQIGSTFYSLNWIPLGGFVKIKGENGDGALEPDSFAAKSIWRRILVIIAGVCMNVLTGWFLLTILFMLGAPTDVTGTHFSGKVTNRQLIVASVLPDSPAAIAGVPEGAEIVSINGAHMENVAAFMSAVSIVQEPLELMYKSGTETNTVLLTPVAIAEYDSDRPVIGLRLAEVGMVRLLPHQALVAGAEATYRYMSLIVSTFASLLGAAFTGGQVADSIGGPIAIAVATNDVLALGLSHVLIFTAVLSFNLAIINILPFPALDGGRIVFLLIEAVRRKPSRADIEAWFHRIGFILLMTLAVVVTYRDIMRFGGRMWRALLGA